MGLNLPYYPISKFYIKKFGSKVYKIPVLISNSCPKSNLNFNNTHLNSNNKSILASTQFNRCIFCDNLGSVADERAFDWTFQEQIKNFKKKIEEKHKVKKFLIYFQAFTSNYNSRESLQKCLEIAFKQRNQGIKGIVFSTRPDCIDRELIENLLVYKEKCKDFFVGIELGIQSFNDKHLFFLNRGHDNKTSIKAINLIKSFPEINLGIHLIFGLPEETNNEIIKTAQIVYSLNIDNVKLHNLHVLKGSDLENMYQKKEFVPCSLEEYTNKVILFLQYLHPTVAVQRLSAVAGIKGQLIAPLWAGDKMRIYQHIIDELNRQKAFQGQYLGGI